MSAQDTSIEARKKVIADLAQALEDVPIRQGDARYFPFHEAAGEPRGDDPIRSLRGTIQMRSAKSTCQLFGGFRGSGKSTELLRLKALLDADGYPVFFVEGWQYINLHKPLETSDLLLSVAAAVAEQAARLRNVVEDGPFERIIRFLRETNVNLQSIELGPDVGGVNMLGKLTFELSRNPTFKDQVQAALRGRLADFVSAFKTFMAEIGAVISPADDPLPTDRRPVLIVDDVEKIRGSGPEQDRVQRQLEEVFSQFAWALHIEGWHTVWTVPPYLQLLNSAIPAHFDLCAVLPMVRLWKNDAERSVDHDGIDAMLQCLRLRGPVESLVASPALLQRLIAASSGSVRDLVRLIRELSARAYMAPDPRVALDEKVVAHALDDYMKSCQRSVYADDYEWLKYVATTRDIIVSKEANIPRAAKLLDTAAVMTYRNGTQWFDVHQALRAKVLG